MQYYLKTHARRYAFQFLYSKKMTPGASFDAAEWEKEWEDFNETYIASGLADKKKDRKQVFLFGKKLIFDLVQKYDIIREKIRPCCDRKNFEKLGGIEEKLLMMGAMEILYRDDTPNSVVINEYINLAKEFGSEKTPAFVNGVLDGLAKEESKE